MKEEGKLSFVFKFHPIMIISIKNYPSSFVSEIGRYNIVGLVRIGGQLKLFKLEMQLYKLHNKQLLGFEQKFRKVLFQFYNPYATYMYVYKGKISQQLLLPYDKTMRHFERITSLLLPLLNPITTFVYFFIQWLVTM